MAAYTQRFTVQYNYLGLAASVRPFMNVSRVSVCGVEPFVSFLNFRGRCMLDSGGLYFPRHKLNSRLSMLALRLTGKIFLCVLLT